MSPTLRPTIILVGAAFVIAAFCIAAFPLVAAEPADHASDVPAHSADPAQCPNKATSGAGIVTMTLMFSVSNPKQDVICRYSDGSGASFQVDKGCDVQPTGVIVDGGRSTGGAFSAGEHECRESSPGSGVCHIVCVKR